jgi:hypothetical protein
MVAIATFSTYNVHIMDKQAIIPNTYDEAVESLALKETSEQVEARADALEAIK